MTSRLFDERKEIKIRRKISLNDFAQLLNEKTEKIVISDSIVRQSKSLGIMLDTLEKVYNLPNLPTIEILERGKGPRIIKQDWIDPEIRNILGKRPTVGAAIEIRLLKEKAISKNHAVELSQFNPQEIKEITNLKTSGHIAVTDDLKIYLTKIGIDISKGARKLYDL